MNESYVCKNQNQVPEDVMKEMLGGKCQCGKQKGGGCEEDPGEEFSKLRDEMEQNNYLRKAEKAIQDTMQQNADLRERIAMYQEKISVLEQEIRTLNSEDGDDMIRLIRKLSGTDAAEIQVTVRMKNYYDD